MTKKDLKEEYLETIKKYNFITDILDELSFSLEIINLVHEYRFPLNHFELYDKVMNRLSISNRDEFNFYQNDFIPNLFKRLKSESVIKSLVWKMFLRLVFKHLIYQKQKSKDDYNSTLNSMKIILNSINWSLENVLLCPFSEFARLNFDHEKEINKMETMFHSYFWAFMNAEFLENENEINVAISILSNFYYKTGNCEELLKYFSSPLNETVNNVLIEAIIFKYDFKGEAKKGFKNPSHSIIPLAKKDYEYESIKTEIVKFGIRTPFFSEKIKYFYIKNNFRFRIKSLEGFGILFDQIKSMNLDPRKTMKEIIGFPNKWNQETFDNYRKILNISRSGRINKNIDNSLI